VSNQLSNQLAEQAARRAVIRYYPEDIDDDSRVWRIEGDAGNDSIVHVDLGSTITFALNDPARPIGAYFEDRPAGDSKQDFAQIRQILAELFGDEAADFIGRIPPVSEVDEELADWEKEIFKTEVSVEVKNPELARILGRLATIDFIRGERRHPYAFRAEEKQEMIRRGEELYGGGSNHFNELIEFHERIQAAKDRFFSHNPIPSEGEIAIEEDKLLTQLSEWLVVPGLGGWIRNRRRT
jgi:hypothetical protein